MIFNRDVLKVGDDYFNWSDTEIQAHFLPQMRQTAMSAAHKEAQEAKQLKKQAAEVKKVEVASKKSALVEKRRLAALEKEKVSGMDAATKKAYLKNKKQSALMDAQGEAKLL